MTVPQPTPRQRDEPASISEVVDLVTAYAKQETLGPLRGAGKWIGRGVAGAACLGLGLSLVALAILRLVQTEWDRSAEGSLSWIPYLIALVFCGICIAVAISRINKNSLNKEPH